MANRVALADLPRQMTSLPYVWFGSGLHQVLPGIAEIKRFLFLTCPFPEPILRLSHSPHAHSSVLRPRSLLF